MTAERQQPKLILLWVQAFFFLLFNGLRLRNGHHWGDENALINTNKPLLFIVDFSL